MKDIDVYKISLAESLSLQSHYASLLNMYDEGERRQFKTNDEWIDRLKEIKKIYDKIEETSYEIIITVDTNDADYVTKINTISHETLEIIKPLIKAIKDFKPYKVEVNNMSWTHSHNYPWGEYLPREDLGEKSVEELYSDFDELAHETLAFLLPMGFDFHTIKSIEVCPIRDKERLL